MKFLTIITVVFVSFGALAQQNTDTTKILTPEAREVFIQSALKLRSDNNFEMAVSSLDSILDRNPVDAGALLFKGDLLLQLNQHSEAVKTYQQLLPLNYEPVITQINLSYALFLTHKPKKALKMAQAAWELDKQNTIGIINHFNAMLWNTKTNEAKLFLLENDTLLDDSQKLLLNARLLMTQGQYTQGHKAYEDLLSKHENKYFTKEFTEALIGKKEYLRAENLIKKDSLLFSENEYQDLLEKINEGNRQSIGSKTVYFEDIAQNTRFAQEIFWEQKESNKYRFKVGAKNTLIKSNEINKTTGKEFYISCDQRWGITLTGKSAMNITQLKSSMTSSRILLTGKQEIMFKPNDRKMIGASISSEILNFTADLFAKGTRMTQLGYETHIMFNARSGFFSQGSAGIYSDDNKRLLFFGSLYHTIRTEPTIKSGLNISTVHFTNQNITDYFSPKVYLNSEVFADFMTALPNSSRLYFYTLGAIGIQKIETNSIEPVFRFESKLGANFKNFNASLKYQTSNVSTESGTGYKYNWFTLELLFKL